MTPPQWGVIVSPAPVDIPDKLRKNAMHSLISYNSWMVLYAGRTHNESL
eukprot:CAMPEP_0175088092 /NCGR_PEP_ID=MMETSP0086_2-20121207/67_1 /TAXON_ID=136419 /ORGANISM="Unknown Unknown, Strain D1" /LENGTH=48 /DNA_ID= /DNA_START= /DNA_END= /DNA_ORIENTATION=